MMEEKEIIEKLRELREIKPERKWVKFNKKNLLGNEFFEFFPFFNFKPLYAGLFLILITIGLFGASQSSLPGEPLYYIKKIGEETKKILTSETDKTKLELELAQKRLEELKRIAEKNDVKKLAPALLEYKNSSSQVKENLVKSKRISPEIVQKTLELEREKDKLEKVLGIKIEEDEEETEKIIVNSLIEDLKNRSLNEQQKENFEKALKSFEEGEYRKALEILLLLNYNFAPIQ